MKKIMKIRSISSNAEYVDYLGQEQVIDDLYMKSIKMKLATAEIGDWKQKIWYCYMCFFIFIYLINFSHENNINH